LPGSLLRWSRARPAPCFLSEAIEREVELMKMPLFVVSLTAIGFVTLSPASRAAPLGGGGFHSGGGVFHGGGVESGFAGHSSGRAFSIGGPSVTVPHVSSASGFARGLRPMAQRRAPLAQSPVEHAQLPAFHPNLAPQHTAVPSNVRAAGFPQGSLVLSVQCLASVYIA
jgi:hypothetical protein